MLGPPPEPAPSKLPRRRLPRYLPSLYTRPPRRRHQGHPPTSGEGYVPGSLVEHYLTRRSRGSSKPPAPEEEIADPDEGLEEIIVDEVPPEFRESPPKVPPLRQPFRLSIWTACSTISRQTSPQGMSVREMDGQINGGSPRAGMTRRTTSQRKGGPNQKLGAACSRRLRAPPPLERTALARTPDPGNAASSSTAGAPPETLSGAPMEVEEEGAGSPEEEICFTGDYSDMAPDYDE